MIDPKLIEAVAMSDYKGNLLTLLRQLKDEVADIRVGKYTNETREAVMQIIDDRLINKMRVYVKGEEKKEEEEVDVDDYH